MRVSRPMLSSVRISSTVASVASRSNQRTVGGRDGRALRVGAFLLAQPVGERHLAGERAGQFGAQQGRIGHPAEPRLDDEAVHRHRA